EERRAGAGLRADADRPTHPADELPADVEAQPGPAVDVGLAGVAPVELLEDRLLLRRGDAEALVPDVDADAGLGARGRDRHLAALRGVLDRVVDQVDEHLLDPVAVADHRRAV